MQNQQISQLKEEAIPLITYDQTSKKFIISSEAEKFLKKLDSPLGIISVAGMYRTGKSYLLNRMLLNRQSGFSVSPTINPCTKGLWIWPKPIQGYSPDGSSINVLIIDTEGIGAMDEDSNHDTRIFTLAILLSSYFIYNSLGSIDENALQNLSFVINLTKHIQVKSNSTEIDIDEYAHYFPSFMWVVRDFTLQLVDEEGENITSKEYLEKSLDMQKGFSDTIEQKNRIRRLIKNFFKERDCCTVVRPLTSEENLQNLEKVDVGKLRPEFVEQLNSLKKKVLNKVRPKTLNGKKLNGEMLFNLMNVYLNSINSGAVPNIENAWTYLCKNECEKAATEALEIYEVSMKEGCLNKFPMAETDICILHSKAKENAMKIFKKRAVGNLNEEYMTELKKKIKTKLSFFNEENEKEMKKKCLIFLNKSFTQIDRKIQSNSYNSAGEFEGEIRAFSIEFNEKGPTGPGKKIILNEFLLKSTLASFDLIMKHSSKENDSTVKILNETIHKMKKENTETSQNYRNQVTTLEDLCKVLKEENDKKELLMKEHALNATKEKDHVIKDLSSKNEKLKSSYENQINELKIKYKQAEDSAVLNEKKLNAIESEYEKKRLLFEKNIEHQISEYQAREQNYLNDIKKIKQENTNNLLKEVQIKNDNEVTKLAILLEESREKYNELEGTFKEKTSFYETEHSHLNDVISQSKNQLEEQNQTILNLKTKVEKIKEKNLFNSNQMMSEYETKIEAMRNTILDFENKIKESEDNSKSIKNKLSKENAIFQQKNEFLEIEVNELKGKYSDLESILTLKSQEYENQLTSISNEKENAEISFNEKSMTLSNKMILLEDESIRERNILMNQLEALKLKYSEEALKLSEENKSLIEENSRLTTSVTEGEKRLDSLQESASLLEAEKNSLILANEMYIKELKNEYEEKHSELLKKMREETEESNKQSEHLLNQLKSAYENEKNKLGFKLFEERQNYDKKYNDLIEEYESRVKDELAVKEEEINSIKEDYSEIEEHYQEYVVNAKNEISALKQKIETLERFLTEANTNINKTVENNNLQLEQLNEKYLKEKAFLSEKTEKIISDLSKKNLEFAVISQEKLQLEKNFAECENELERVKIDVENALKIQEEEKIKEKDTLMERIKNISNEKLGLEKSIALMNQQNEFKTRKIEELEALLETMKTDSQERLIQLKAQFEAELKQFTDKSNREKEDLSHKLLRKRKDNKDSEINFNKQISILEKEKYILSEKIVNSEVKKKEIIENYEKEKELLQKQIIELSAKLNSSKDVNIVENRKLKSKLDETESQKNELQSNYDKDKALWESKFAYLESQKENGKKEQKELIRKYDLTIENLCKKHSSEKEKSEFTNKAVLNSLEERCRSQLKELNENNKNVYSDIVSSNKTFEKEVKFLNEKLQNEQKSRIVEENIYKKKISELLENDEKLKQTLSNVRNELSQKVSNSSKSFEAERDQLKKTITEIEQKFRDSENKRSSLLFELEKARNTWEIEKKGLVERSQEKSDQLKVIERKVDLLTRENEKARNDKSQNKNLQSKNNLHRITFSSRFGSANKENNKIFENSFDKSLDNSNINSPKMLFKSSTLKTKSGQSQDSNSTANNYNNLNIEI